MPWLKIINHTPAESLVKLGAKLTHQLTEFDVIGSPVAEEVVKYDEADFTNWSQIHVHFEVRRRIGYYVLKILTVLIFLAVLMGLSFIVPADVLNDRFQIAATLFLSAVCSSKLPTLRKNFPQTDISQLLPFRSLSTSLLRNKYLKCRIQRLLIAISYVQTNNEARKMRNTYFSPCRSLLNTPLSSFPSLNT
jgi:hypothetical protein